MPSRRVQRPDPPPLETNDTVVVAVCTALWAVGLAVLAVLRLATDVRVEDWWLAMCACGIVLGLVGIRYCRRRHAAIERDKARGLPQRS
jgi:H+/Cl- antiporter ClcA